MKLSLCIGFLYFSFFSVITPQIMVLLKVYNFANTLFKDFAFCFVMPTEFITVKFIQIQFVLIHNFMI